MGIIVFVLLCIWVWSRHHRQIKYIAKKIENKYDKMQDEIMQEERLK